MAADYDLKNTEARNWRVGDVIKLDGVERKILNIRQIHDEIEITVEGNRTIGSIPESRKATIGRAKT